MQLRIAILDQEAIVDVYILLAVLLEKSENNTEVSSVVCIIIIVCYCVL